MSYCRFSSDSFRSDVYVYEDVDGGWTIHIAGNRHVGPEPRPQLYYPRDSSNAEIDKCIQSRCEIDAWLVCAEIVPIDLPYVGEAMNLPSPGDAADTLVMLRDLGYYVPQYAIEALLDEAAESSADE